MDRSLLDAARNGDPRARDALGRWLFRELVIFFKRQQHPVSIEELVQASATEIFATLSTAPDDPQLFRGWVLERAGMRARAIRRDTHREHARIGGPPHTPAESPSVSVMGPLFRLEKRELVLDHAQRLQPMYRTAVMHVLDGGDYKSLAVSEGIPEITAWARLRKATELVRRSITEQRRTRPSCQTPA